VKDSRQRPDLTSKNIEALPDEVRGDADQILIGVTVRAPVDGAAKCDIPTSKSREAALETGRRAQHAYQEKSSKYDQLIEKYNGPLKFKVIPFVKESTGILHKKSLDFLKTIAERADEAKRITNENILTCFKRRLSCALVKITAHSILTRTAKISERVGLYEERGFNPK
jgi:hypothetical protein